MNSADILTNIKTTIEDNTAWKSWVEDIWKREPKAENCLDEDDAISLPAVSNMPISMIFMSDPTDFTYDVPTALRGILHVKIITWIWGKSTRELWSDLLTAGEYIAKALMVDETRGGNAMYHTNTTMSQPVIESEPVGRVEISTEIFYTVKEAD